MRSVERDVADDPGAGADPGLDPDRASDRGETIAHAGDAAALGDGRDGEPAAVVADLEAEVAVVAQLDLDCRRPGRVLGRVLQRLEAAEVDRALDLRCE